MKRNCIDIFVKNDLHLIDLITNSYLKDRKHNIVFYCKECGQLVKRQYRKGRIIRLLCSHHTKTMTFMYKYGVENPLLSKEIQAKAHQTIHIHSQERKQKIEKQKQIKKQQKQQKKIDKIISEYGSIENYNIYNSLNSASKKHRFREIINHGSHENAQRIKVENTKRSNLNKYGVEWISQTKQYKNAIINRNQELYGVDWYYQSDDFKKKSCMTKLDRYNDKHYRNEKQIFETCLHKYGSISPLGNVDVRTKIAQTNIANFGVDNPWKLKEIQDKCKYKYMFEGKYFDSAPEIAFFIWLRDNNIEFEYQPNISFDYMYDGKIHRYFPDFKVGDILFEIKGDHFFKDGKMICPYRDKSWTDEQYILECAKYEAKHQCMLKNDVVILTNESYKMFLCYVNQRYGNDYLKKFKNEHKG